MTGSEGIIHLLVVLIEVVIVLLHLFLLVELGLLALLVGLAALSSLGGVGVALIRVLVVLHKQVVELLVGQVIAVVHLLPHSVPPPVLLILLGFVCLSYAKITVYLNQAGISSSLMSRQVPGFTSSSSPSSLMFL